jgi:phosphomannomutase
MSLDSVMLAALDWLAQDPDPETRAELSALIESGDEQALTDRMGSRLAFGTAGLRGELGAGPNRMNRVLVAQAAAGLAEFLISNRSSYADQNGQLSVVIGFDGRKNSAIFARDSASIFTGAGIITKLFDSVVPTPVLAFAGKHLGTSAAVMVTASHNPPRDNGYKVYLGAANGGSQIVSPADKQIAAHIADVAAAKSFNEIKKSDDFELVGDELRHAYIGTVAELAPEVEGAERLKIVYTAMHGVGWHIIKPVFEAVGIPEPITVTEQLLPDSDFPTVDFPNPEEPGAMDLSFAKAREVDADLIIANDPDADRLAVAIRDSSAAGVGYRRLTGDELGLILGDEIARQAKAAGAHGTLACSIVSSSALGKVAKHYGLDYAETLTGFKYIAKVPNLIFGYEEALGYCVAPNQIPDKDGISAALVFADLAARLANEGKTIESHLAELGERYGHFATGQISIRVSDLSIISNIMQKLRLATPATIAGVEAKFTDLALGSENLGPTDGVRFDLADGRRAIIRPSGTEPKLKCYLQAIGQTKAQAVSALAELEQSFRELL